ncbi:MAG: MiaB/RimO family radical SAM methylthiotransferase, partial [Muribaculaceae bacterium]|nr:MiaB/RimO family radical SAM methylthiotransferase [Muribaculaceae bacterium]
MQKNRIDIITLGCSKNLVDSEKLIKQFKEIGYDVYHDSNDVKGEVVIINTCGFIGDAKEESINMILDFCQAKKARKIKRLYVMGCLSQRYAPELIEEIPEVDGFFGKFDWEKIVKEVGGEYNEALANSRELTTPSHYAYLKISEGCNRTCAYCAIPIITGKYKSRSIEDLVEEARGLADMGVKELQLIAQDLTYYGLDIYKSYQLPTLVEELSKIDGIEWIRLHYAYPAHFPYELLPVMAQNEKVCKYLDIALQHVSNNMLSRMHRNVTKEQTYELIERIRREVPGIHLRTTLMVGFPGETEEDFAELMEFVK